MIKTTVDVANASVQAFRSLLGVKMPAVTAYKIARIARAVGNEVDLYEEQRVALVKSLGAEDGDGNFTVTPENAAAFGDEIKQLLNAPLEFQLDPVKVSELGAAEVSPGMLMQLGPFIVADGE